MPELTPQICTCCPDMPVRGIQTDEFAADFHYYNKKVIPTLPTTVGGRLPWDLKSL